MKTKLTFLSLAITLLSSCYHTTIKYNDEVYCTYPLKGVEYTNTSTSKYIEVTIKYDFDGNGKYKTYTQKLKPGQIATDCIGEKGTVVIVGEREIYEE